VFLVVSVSTATLFLALSVLVYVVGLLVPVVLAPGGARRLATYLRSRPSDTSIGVFYLLAPAREWLHSRGVDLFRLDQFVALVLSDRKLQFWASGRRPRLLYQVDLRPGMRASSGDIDGYRSLDLHLDGKDSLQLLQWKELLGVQEDWPIGWVEKIADQAERGSHQ
jgi:uncharacterized protein YjeT (DUF2065 family)